MQYAYVGCRTTKERNAKGKGISVYEVRDDGWHLKQIAENLVNPSYQCFDETKQNLYTIHGDRQEISAFSIAPETGELTFINRVPTGGVNPVHLSIDATNQWIFVANLQSGKVSVIPRNQDGSLAPPKEIYTIPGKGEGTISHPHQVMQDIKRNFLIVSCQGRSAGFGQVDVFKIHSQTGTLEKTSVFHAREEAEPRHVVFHPNNRFCYGVNEKEDTVSVYDFDDKEGILTEQQKISLFPGEGKKEGWASGIVIDKGGNYIVVSNRIHDCLISFRIDQVNGRLQRIDTVDTGGKQPRYIVMNPDTNTILAANEVTDTLKEFRIDVDSGKMEFTGLTVNTESPVCVSFLDY